MRADTRRALAFRTHLASFGAEGSDRLTARQTLTPGQSIQTTNGNRFTLQTDGNAVVYQGKQALWATNTVGKQVSSVVMQADGNLVLYDENHKPVWATGTNGHTNVYVVIQTDGNLVLYESGNKPVWASKDHGKKGFNLIGSIASLVNTAVSSAGKLVGAALHTVAGGLHDIQNAIAKIPYVGGVFATLYDLGTAPFTYQIYIADAISKGESFGQSVLDALSNLRRELSDVLPWVATIVSCFPVFGPLVSSIIMTASALMNGEPLTEVAITAALSLIPGMAAFAHYLAPIIQFGIDLAMACAKGTLDLAKIVVDGLKAIFQVIDITMPDFIYTAVSLGIHLCAALARGMNPEIAVLQDAITFLKQSGKELLGSAFNSKALDDLSKVVLDVAASQADRAAAHIKLAKQLSDVNFPKLPGPLNSVLRKVMGCATSMGCASNVQQGVKANIDKAQSKIQADGAKLATTQASKQFGTVAQKAENQVILQARKLLPAPQQSGFDAGIQVMQSKVTTFEYMSVRSNLDAEGQKGFDAASALHIGRVAVPPPPVKPGATPAEAAQRRVGFAMMHGSLAMPPESQSTLTQTIATNPVAKQGLNNASLQIAQASLPVEYQAWSGTSGSQLHLGADVAARTGIVSLGYLALGLKGKSLLLSTLATVGGVEVFLLGYGLWRANSLRGGPSHV